MFFFSLIQDGMKEKLAADSKKTQSVDSSGNEASSEDSSDSNGVGVAAANLDKDSIADSNAVVAAANVAVATANDDETTTKATSSTAEISSLIGMMSQNGGGAEYEWTGSDQSMFRAIHKIYLNNYCAIAQVMLTKSCQQVSHFSYLYYCIY